jgi:hypothetical protein
LSQQFEGYRAYLDEANVLGVAAEALPAAHQPVLPNQTVRVGTDPAAKATKFGLVQEYRGMAFQ